MPAITTGRDLLELPDVKVEIVEVPEWDCTCHVRTMTAAEFMDFVDTVGRNGTPDLGNYLGRLAAVCLATPTGDRLFSDSDAEALGRKNARALRRIQAVAERINGLAVEAREDAKKN